MAPTHDAQGGSSPARLSIVRNTVRVPDRNADVPRARRSRLEKAARGGVLNLFGAAVAAVANFALTVVLARGLSLPVAGTFFAVTSVFLIATTVGRLGTDAGLVYFLSRCRALNTLDHVRSYVRVAVTPVVLVGISMAVLTFAMAPHIATWVSPSHASLAEQLLRILAPFMPIAAVEYTLLSATRGLGTMRATAVVERIGRPTLQLLMTAAAVLGSSAGLVAVGWSLSYLPALAAAWLWWRNLARRYPRSETPAPRLGRQFWLFSGPRSLASVAQLGMQRFDIILVAALAGAASAAVYAATTRFVVLGQMARQSVSLAVQPLMAEALANGDRKETNHLYQATTAWLIIVTWPVYLLFAILGAPLLRVFGQGYADGALILAVVSVAMLVATACGDVDIVLIMAGRTSWSLANMMLALSVNLGLDLWLIPTHGALGAAIGWSAAIATKNLSALAQVGLSLRLHPLGRATTTALLLNVGSFGVTALLGRSLLGASLATLLSSAMIGLVVYGLGAWRARRVLQLDVLRAIRRRSPVPSDTIAPA